MPKYSIDDLHVVNDAIKHVRDHKEMYLRGDTPSYELIAGRLVSDLICYHALPASVEKRDDWWIVSSAVDWMDGDDIDKLFNSIRSHERLGVNSVRSEILLSSFCTQIFTCSKGGFSWIKRGGGQAPDDFISSINGRVVGFK